MRNEKKSFIGLPSTDAEYVALSKATTKAVDLEKLLAKLEAEKTTKTKN